MACSREWERDLDISLVFQSTWRRKGRWPFLCPAAAAVATNPPREQKGWQNPRLVLGFCQRREVARRFRQKPWWNGRERLVSHFIPLSRSTLTTGRLKKKTVGGVCGRRRGNRAFGSPRKGMTKQGFRTNSRDSGTRSNLTDIRPQYAERRKGAAVQRTGRRYTEAPFTIEASYASYAPMQSTSNTGIRRAFAGDNLGQGVHVNKKATAAASRQMGYHYEMNYKSGFSYVGGVTSRNILGAPLNRSRRMPHLPSACAPGNAECSNMDTKGSHASAALSSWYRRDILGPGPGHIPGLSEAAC